MVISFEDDHSTYVLKVNQRSHLLEAIERTDEATSGSPFFLIPVDDGYDYDFYIAYYGEDLKALENDIFAADAEAKIPYYLEANINIFGRNSCPLELKANPQNIDRSCRFTFEPQLAHNGAAISSMLRGKTMFYISRPRMLGDTYVCVTKNSTVDPVLFKAGCINRSSAHNQWSCYMLFRLLSYKPSTPAASTT